MESMFMNLSWEKWLGTWFLEFSSLKVGMQGHFQAGPGILEYYGT